MNLKDIEKILDKCSIGIDEETGRLCITYRNGNTEVKKFVTNSYKETEELWGTWWFNLENNPKTCLFKGHKYRGIFTEDGIIIKCQRCGKVKAEYSEAEYDKGIIELLDLVIKEKKSERG